MLKQIRHILMKVKNVQEMSNEENQEKEVLVVKIELLDYHIIRFVF